VRVGSIKLEASTRNNKRIGKKAVTVYVDFAKETAPGSSKHSSKSLALFQNEGNAAVIDATTLLFS